MREQTVLPKKQFFSRGIKKAHVNMLVIKTTNHTIFEKER